MRWFKASRKHVSLKKRLLIVLIAGVLWGVLAGAAHYYKVSLYLEPYRKAQKTQASCPPSLPVVESERLVAFRQAVQGADWQTFGVEEFAWGEILEDLDFSPDMEGMTQFLSLQLPPFNHWNLRDMALPIVGVEAREKGYQCSDDGLFHLNADRSVGLLFLSDEVTRHKTVHYFHMTDSGLMMGALMRLSEEKREEMANVLDLVPKPEI